MATVSRLVLNHPALGTTGGVALHASVEALYQKIGDAISSRWYQITDFDNGESTDVTHNFDSDISNIRWDLYVYTGGQWVRVTTTSSPARSNFTVAEKVGDEDNAFTITNVSGGNDLLAALVLVNDPLSLNEGDITDVSLSSPTNGQVLTYNSGTNKFENQTPAVAKGYTKYVGSAEAYTTLSAAIAAASAGDWILVRNDTTEPAGDLTLGVTGVRVTCAPNVKLIMSGAMTNGLRLTADRVVFEGRVSLAPSGAQARGISVEAADCRVLGKLELTTAQTLTDALHVTSGGTRTYAQVGVSKTAGTITNLETNNDGAGKTDVWGG